MSIVEAIVAVVGILAFLDLSKTAIVARSARHQEDKK